MSIWKELTNPSSFAGEFDTAVEAPAPVEIPARPNGPSSNISKKESVIGATVVIEGKIDGDGELRIAGSIKGDVHLKGDLILDPGAHIVGAVEADNASLGGHIEGNVTVSGHIQLLETARLIGDVKAQNLTAAFGARVRGKVEFGWDEPELKPLESKLSADQNGTEPRGNIDPQ
jgi:cytoskeletal protein CcmA (bactofilin family)